MQTANHRSVCRIPAFVGLMIPSCLTLFALMADGQAGMLESQTSLAREHTTRDADWDAINSFLSEETIRQRLLKLGLSAEEVEGKIARMNDDELRRLAEAIDQVKEGKGWDWEKWEEGFAVVVILFLLVLLSYLSFTQF